MRRCERSRLRFITGTQKRAAERVLGRQTSQQPRVARAGVTLRDGVIAQRTRNLFAAAFLRLWAWDRRAPSDTLKSAAAYDKFLSGYIEYAWTQGSTRGEAGTALSASIHMYPELRGTGRSIDSWHLLNAWNKYEIPMRALPMPVHVAIALAWYLIRLGYLGAPF